MDFEYYQYKTRETAKYPQGNKYHELVYLVLGLVSEAGEVAGKLKKLIRDSGFSPDDPRLNDAQVEMLISELGDVSWYQARIADTIDTAYSKLHDKNLEKLFNSKDRGVLGGSGDNR